MQMEDFAVTCPLVPDVSHLRSGSCSSPRSFALGFLQTPPRGDALALSLAFGSATTWQEDFHLPSFVPCPAHTLAITGSKKSGTTLFAVRVDGVVSHLEIYFCRASSIRTSGMGCNFGRLSS
jgi:hypothetical protein